MQSILMCEKIIKRFGSLVALNGVTYCIDSNKINCIIGPNGAGKTTLLNVLTGFLKPDQGRVLYHGMDITNLSAFHRARLGIVRTFQLTSVFNKLTVYENLSVSFPLISRYERKNYEQKIRYVANLLGLEDKLDKVTEKISYGDKKKLEIAMALCLNPKILMLDEPFAGLSDFEIDELISALKKIKNEVASIFLIEHKISKLVGLADRVTVLSEGSIICEGSINEVLEDRNVKKAYWGIEGE
ncbi:MAG: ABC transporter ATP-binding protein [Ignisphaera sp.]|uniref:ABC transporter ATP-binding protein n=1 Tax=Saccharolobus sp. TaxID=2100761 RepID=UPI00317421C4